MTGIVTLKVIRMAMGKLLSCFGSINGSTDTTGTLKCCRQKSSYRFVSFCGSLELKM